MQQDKNNCLGLKDLEVVLNFGRLLLFFFISAVCSTVPIQAHNRNSVNVR